MLERRPILLAGLVALFTIAVVAPAQASNPYNASGYMITTYDYAGVVLQNEGAGSMGVRALYNYTAPGSGATTYQSNTYYQRFITGGVPVTTPTPPDMGYTYTTITAFKGCTGSSTTCTLGSWDYTTSKHVFN